MRGDEVVELEGKPHWWVNKKSKVTVPFIKKEIAKPHVPCCNYVPFDEAVGKFGLDIHTCNFSGANETVESIMKAGSDKFFSRKFAVSEQPQMRVPFLPLFGPGISICERRPDGEKWRLRFCCPCDSVLVSVSGSIPIASSADLWMATGAGSSGDKCDYVSILGSIIIGAEQSTDSDEGVFVPRLMCQRQGFCPKH